MLQHVAALGQARANHPVLFGSASTEWWQEDDIYAFARSQDEEHLLVALNRSASDRTLTNGLSFAGLPTDGQWTDLLTGETFQAQDDSLDLTVSARSSRVLLRDSE